MNGEKKKGKRDKGGERERGRESRGRGGEECDAEIKDGGLDPPDGAERRGHPGPRPKDGNPHSGNTKYAAITPPGVHPPGWFSCLGFPRPSRTITSALLVFTPYHRSRRGAFVTRV